MRMVIGQRSLTTVRDEFSWARILAAISIVFGLSNWAGL